MWGLIGILNDKLQEVYDLTLNFGISLGIYYEQSAIHYHALTHTPTQICCIENVE